MGFFSYAYVIEGRRLKGGVEFAVSAYSMGGPALFSWGHGSRPRGMTAIADGTLFCAEPMRPLPGYPRIDKRIDEKSKEPGLHYIEENFFGRSRDEPVLFHVALPKRFVIRRDRTPFTLTKDANIAVVDDRLVFTLPALGGADLRFWIAPLKEGEEFGDYEIDKFLSAPTESSAKIAFELNFGIAKIKIG